VSPIQQAIITGLVRAGLNFNGIKGKAIPEVFGKYTHTPVIDSLSWINIFIKDN
jgi:hypothetical protein